jgi:hypothetical protein
MLLVTLTAHGRPEPGQRGWWQARDWRDVMARSEAVRSVPSATTTPRPESAGQSLSDFFEGERLFDRETFGGNGRTCLTCHSRETGTVSPSQARERFRKNPDDPLFVHDGSDDEDGDGFGDGRHVTRMLADATILMRIPLHPDVELKGHPEMREVTVRRGIPTTLNTPALDAVLMLDGRQPTLQAQALGAIADHAQATRAVTSRELDLLASFQRTVRVQCPQSPRATRRAHGVREARALLLRGSPAGLHREPAQLEARGVRRLSQRAAVESDQRAPARTGS